MSETVIDEPEFTDEQLQAVLKGVGEEARRAAFARGLPVYFIKGRSIVALYEDGHEEIIESIEGGTDHTPARQ